MDQQRVKQIQRQMRQQKLDALVLRLPENIVLSMGIWPMNGMSHAMFTAKDGPVALIAPSCEDQEMNGCWAEDIRYFRWPLLAMDDPNQFTAEQLRDLAGTHGLNKGRIGYEGSFEAVAPSHNAGEVLVPNQASIAELRRTLPGAEWLDVTDFLHQQRACKTEQEVAHLKLAHRVAGYGLKAFHESVDVGRTEAELAGIVYQACLTSGVNTGGVRYVNVYPQVSTGPSTFRAWRPVVTTGKRRLKSGDIALLELAVCVDGFWADVTRVKVAGKPSAIQRDAFAAVKSAQAAARKAIRAGVQAYVPHQRATAILIEAGFEKNIVHLTGHGLGLRYHEPEPFLMPGNTMKLRVGHVCSVEPGLYDPDWGGIRLEDNVVVTAEGCTNLTTTKKIL